MKQPEIFYMTIKLKRIYDPFAETDGYRILVDRLWPRGIKKETAHIDTWLKEIAPSTALRIWFNHELYKWAEFTAKYHAELKDSAALEELLALLHAHQTVTLLYGSKDVKYNQAVALKQFLVKYIK